MEMLRLLNHLQWMQLKLAAVLAKMTSITGSLTYTAKGTSVTPTAGFTALTGVGDLTVDTDGDISFPLLTSADNVILKTNSKTTSVSFPALTSLTDLGGATAGDDVYLSLLQLVLTWDYYQDIQLLLCLLLSNLV